MSPVNPDRMMLISKGWMCRIGARMMEIKAEAYNYTHIDGAPRKA